MIGKITSVPIALHSAYDENKTTLIFMMQTDTGLQKIFYLTKLDHLGNPPKLHIGQHLELTNAILNTHPAGDFYYTTHAQPRPAPPGFHMTPPTPRELQELYQRIFHRTRHAHWVAQGWHDAVSLLREAFPGCTESNDHLHQKPGTDGWIETRHRLNFAVEDDPRHTAAVDLGPDVDHYRIIFMPHAVRAARTILEADATEIPYLALDHQGSPPKQVSFPDPNGEQNPPELTLELHSLQEAILHRATIMEAAKEANRALARRQPPDTGHQMNIR